MNKMLAKKVGIAFVIIHSMIFAFIYFSIEASHDGQAPMMWVILAFIDMPISLLYYLAPFGISKWVYMPYLVHGLLGTIWWFYLPKLFLNKRHGGVWGKT